ncbi:hypothetical protein [Cardiobacterium valvarum]|uniref:hypothetical protein n=1 Tax=Cardiobacterium valvarum TaxID=194702 RepID=UPI0011C0239F|nr:hypothetical protein [Cardiobacterium valvarum]
MNAFSKAKASPPKNRATCAFTIHIDLPQANGDADRAAWEQLARHTTAQEAEPCTTNTTFN